MTTTTLTERQWRIRERVLAANVPAATTLLAELDDGAQAEDVAAVADNLCPGAGEDYRR